MENQTRNKKVQIDWMITIVPLTIVIALCILFFFLPEQSNIVLGKIRFFWRYVWNILSYYWTWNFYFIFIYRLFKIWKYCSRTAR